MSLGAMNIAEQNRQWARQGLANTHNVSCWIVIGDWPETIPHDAAIHLMPVVAEHRLPYPYVLVDGGETTIAWTPTRRSVVALPPPEPDTMAVVITP